MARPSLYSQELANEICARIAEGDSVRTIAKDKNMPNASTIHLWVLEDREGFSKQYEQAKSIGAEVAAEEMEEIARTEEDVQRARLLIDTRKWNLSKKLPKRFGDSLDLTSKGDKLPTPIFGGLSKNGNIPRNNSDTQNIQSEEKD